MAKATFSQPSVRPKSTPSGKSAGPGPLVLILGSAVLAALIGLGLSFHGPGSAIIRGVHWFLEFYVGVLSLVALSICIMIGLAATDRIVLMIRHRILLQAVHRTMAMASMVFLAMHIVLKILEGHATIADAVVPFLSSHRVIFVGLGTIASWMMILVTWTGIVRGRFAGSQHPWLWRSLHVNAYLCWPFALVHGLEAGRHAKTWVTVSYIVCVILVVLALFVRIAVSFSKRLNAPKAQTTGTIKAIGKPVAALPAAPARRRESLMPANDGYGYDAAPYDADRYDTGTGRGPVSRGRLAVESRTGRSAPSWPDDDSGEIGYPGQWTADEGIDDWTSHETFDAWRGFADTPAPTSPPPAPQRPLRAISDRPADPGTLYQSGEYPTVGRHSGEYRTVGRHSGEYRNVGRHSGEYRVYEPEAYEPEGYQQQYTPGYGYQNYGREDYSDRSYPDQNYSAQSYAEQEYGGQDYGDQWYDVPDQGYVRPRTPVDDLISPASASPVSRGRRRRSADDANEISGPLPRTRQPAREISDEEFWTTMRGDSLR